MATSKYLIRSSSELPAPRYSSTFCDCLPMKARSAFCRSRYQVVISSLAINSEIGSGVSYSQRTRSGAAYEKTPRASLGSSSMTLSLRCTNEASMVSSASWRSRQCASRTSSRSLPSRSGLRGLGGVVAESLTASWPTTEAGTTASVARTISATRARVDGGRLSILPGSDRRLQEARGERSRGRPILPPGTRPRNRTTVDTPWARCYRLRSLSGERTR